MSRLPESFPDLVEHWTLMPPTETDLLAGKHDGPSKLAFALLLKFYGRYGRFPRGRAELRDETVEFVAAQVNVPAAGLGLFEWDGRTVKRHRAEIRRFFGFRMFTVADSDKLTDWLAGDYAQGSAARSWSESSSWRSAGPGAWSRRRPDRSTASSPAR